VRRAAFAALGLPFVVAGVVVLAAGHAAVALVPSSLGLLFLLAGRLSGRRATAAWLLAVGLGLTWTAVRLAVVATPEGWLACDGDACTRGGPWWSRVLPEHASLDSGFVLSRLGGLVSADEQRRYAAAFAGPMAALPAVPNALTWWSTGSHLRRLVVTPGGTDARPGVVFLHGFGGLSSAYVRVIADALPEVVVVAPALDVGARWDSPRGRAVVELTLATLPPRVDRQRVVLLGLSNGAIFGARYARLFHGAVLVSGVGDTDAPVHLVTGADDARISAAWMRQVAQALHDGVAVELDVVDGADHGLLLTHPARWAEPVRRLLDAPGPRR